MSPESDPMSPVERRATAALAAVFAMRMLGLFVILPVFSLYGGALSGANAFLVGVAIGAYGLAQGILQIPFGVLSDRYGRKPVIYVALALFAAGGMVAAASDSIYGVIAGRTIQGCGAVSGVVMALLTDLTREAHRGRAMAIVGATVGLSFAMALVLGPVIAAATGLGGLFAFTSLMAAASILLVAWIVPTPVQVPDGKSAPVWPQLVRVLRHPGLFRLNAGVFLLHFVMVAVFLVVPPALVHYEQLPAASHWRIYLPVVLASLLVMLPMMRMAERRGRVREALVGSGVALAASMLMLAGLYQTLWGTVVSLWVYFSAFNLLEALMPSLASRMSPPGARGAAMGVFSSGQFLGAFFGGVAGGALSAWLPPGDVLVTCAVMFLGWCWLAAGLRESAGRREISLGLPEGLSGEDVRALAGRLAAVDGVLDAKAVTEDGIVNVIVDVARCDERKLHAVLAASPWDRY